jgi:hypothetical protein
MKNEDKIKNLEKIISSKDVGQRVKDLAQAEIDKLKSKDEATKNSSFKSGHIIGKTKSGKPVHAGEPVDSYKDFTSKDHKDAELLYRNDAYRFSNNSKIKENRLAFAEGHKILSGVKSKGKKSHKEMKEEIKSKGLKSLLKDEPKASEVPDCDELLAGFKKRKAQRKKYKASAPKDAGDVIKKAAEKAKTKIKGNKGLASQGEKTKISKAITSLIDTIKNDKDLIKELISKLKALL